MTAFTFKGVIAQPAGGVLSTPYESTIEGCGITVKYEDNGTADSSLKDIIPPEVSGPYEADSSVEGEYQEQYGYSLNPIQSGRPGALYTV